MKASYTCRMIDGTLRKVAADTDDSVDQIRIKCRDAHGQLPVDVIDETRWSIAPEDKGEDERWTSQRKPWPPKK